MDRSPAPDVTSVAALALSPGERLGPYEIQAIAGSGGMGEVYRARDTRLGRTVAIKVLPAHLSGDAAGRARFEREAKAVAALNHPHICTLYDVGEHASPGSGATTVYLVMEHLAGETLASRIRKGSLPLEQVLTIAIEIAEALTAAHRQGVVHRDLKPGNVMLTKGGAKLLDFGLAKLTAHGEQAAVQLTTERTRSPALTAEGVVVGTLQYMAPEQLEGKPADARTDIWALGAIIYEMAAGKPAFDAESAVALIAAILEHEPTAITALRPLAPPSLDRLVRQCLAKSPDDRPDTAHDVAGTLRLLGEMGGPREPVTSNASRRPVGTALRIATSLLLLAAGAAGMWLLGPSPMPGTTTWLSLDVRPAQELNAGGLGVELTRGGALTALAWTPDGQTLVFVGRRAGVQQLYRRRLDEPEARAIANTEGAQGPALSRDGAWVAFWARGAIRKVRLADSAAAEVLAGIREPAWGLAWDADGGIYFGRERQPISYVRPGGTPKPVTTLRPGELGHSLPALLPDGRTLLFTIRKRVWSWADEEVVAQRLASGARVPLLRNATDARFVSTGHLLFLRRGSLVAVPFDPVSVAISGDEAPVGRTIAQALFERDSANLTGAGHFALSALGTLAWVEAEPTPPPPTALVTIDRSGTVTALPTREQHSHGAVLRRSPDERLLAVHRRDLDAIGLWAHDIVRGTSAPLLHEGEAVWAIWSPDGRQVVFDWLKDGRYTLAALPSTGSAQPRVLAEGNFYPSSFTPDGRILAVRGFDGIVTIAADGSQDVRTLVETPDIELGPDLSPDGRWLAYASNVSGRFEVYVRPYQGAGAPVRVSLDGGANPAWNPAGGELFYTNRVNAATGTLAMMAARFSPGGAPGTPRPLFEFSNRELTLLGGPVRAYDVSRDGLRFYGQRRTPTAPPSVTHLNVVLNWFEELKATVSAAR